MILAIKSWRNKWLKNNDNLKFLVVGKLYKDE